MSWPVVRFETLYVEPSRNGIYKAREHHGNGVKIVNMGELFSHNVIADQEMNRLKMSESEMGRFGLTDGDLLFGRRSLVEAGAGKCSLVEGLLEPTTFESSIIRVRLDNNKARPRFYWYWFQSHQGKGVIRAIVTGTNVKGVTGTNLKTIKVVRPPVEIQDRVIARLRAYDDLIENNRRRITLLEQAARLLFKEWFVHLRFPGHEHVKVVDGVPKGWEKSRLVEMATIVMGQSPSSEHYNSDGDGLPFHQGVTHFGERFVEHEIFCTVQGRIAEPGDILCSVRAPVGRVNITLDRIVIGRGLSAIRAISGCQSFLFYQLKSHFFKEDMIGGGAIFAAVTKKDMENQLLLSPTAQLIEEFEHNSKPIDEQIKTLYIQNRNLKRARDLLLPRLMNGEIVV